MAAAALLSSPRPGSDVATVGAPSVTLSSPSRASGAKNVRLHAAADLIRNLDAALSGMTAAAASASEDAARARRNAKAAGEVARRYGGTSLASKGGSGRKKKGAIDRDSMLERKRERRAAARMAAEARQRKDHPMLTSPRKTPRSTRGGMGVFWGAGSPPAPMEPSTASRNAAAVEEKKIVQDRTSATTATRSAPVEIKVETDSENYNANVASKVGPVQTLFYASTPLGNTEVVSNHTPVIAQSTPFGTIEDSIPPVITEGSNVSNLNDFEDAVEHQNPEGGVQAEYNAHQPPTQQNQPSQPQATQQTAEGVHQTADSYYMQQNQHYNQQQQQYQEQQQPHYQQWNQGQNTDYYNQSQQQHYPGLSSEPQPQTQQQPLKEANAPVEQPGAPSPKHTAPPTPPRAQPASTNRIEASHAEDVLSLSLELERVRAQLASTTTQLSDATTQVGYLTSQNASLEFRLSDQHSEFESANERSSNELATAREQLEGAQIRSKAAEEDAALALELAKEAQQAKEECETWLSRSLEEIDLWRGRVGGLEHQLKEQKEAHLQELQRKEEEVDSAREAEQEPKKRMSVRFMEDCPPSPVVSEDGGFEDIAEEATPPVPQPPAPPAWSSPAAAKNDVGSLGAATSNDAASPIVANDGISGINSGVFSPPTSNGAQVETPSKSDMIASGRAFLQRASPSPLKTGLSPHPREQAMSLLKKSAETRRLLRERLTPGSNGGAPHRPPVTSAKMARPSSDNALSEKGGSFASRQGAACKAIGRTVRESGTRLKLDGTFLIANGDGSPGSEPVIEGVAQLESMVKGYCSRVEGTIGQQQERIDELEAFCDHLEKEVMLERK